MSKIKEFCNKKYQKFYKMKQNYKNRPTIKKLRGWKRSALIVASALIFSILLNLTMGIAQSKRITIQEQEIQNKQVEIENLTDSVNKAQEQLDQNEITEKEFQQKIEKLNKEKEELNKQLQAKREAEEKARKATVYAAEAPKTVQITGTCQEWMNKAGITDQQNAYFIFMKESGCNPQSRNRSSGAYGVCQALPASKMVSAGSDYLTNPVTQMKWCQSYALGRYGSWANAVAFWNRNHWW